MAESVPPQHPTWDFVQGITGEYEWDYDGIHFSGEIVGTSSSMATNVATLGLGSGAYDGIEVKNVIHDKVSKSLEELQKDYYVGAQNGNAVFYLNRITNLKPIYGHYTHNVSTAVSGTNLLLQKQDSISSMSSSESSWSSSSGEISIQDVKMPSVVSPSQRKFADSSLYKELLVRLKSIARYQQLWEFFNEFADESDITFEQYTTLVNLPLDIEVITSIIQYTKNDLSKENPTSHIFNRMQYEDIIRNSPTKRSKPELNLLIQSIPNVPAGAIILSYYQKEASRFSSGDKNVHVYYVRVDGVISSTKNPSSSYSYSGLSADEKEFVFKVNQGSAVASNVSRVGSRIGSSIGSTVKRGFSSMFSRTQGGRRRTRRNSKKSSTRKGGKAGRCRDSCKMSCKKRK
jgi:hypothetical protein